MRQSSCSTWCFLLILLTIMLVVGKLTGMVSWSWWVILSPIIVPALSILGLVTTLGFIIVIMLLLKSFHE